MATDTNVFQEVGSGIIERVFSGVIWFGIAFIIIAVVGFLLWFFFIYRRKFDIKVKIKSERSEDDYSIIWDKAAILKGLRDKIPYFRVWNLKRDFPVPRFKILQKTSDGDYLEILRKGEDEFYFLTPSKIDTEHIIKADGKQYKIAEQSQIQIDPEMAFWIAKRKDKNKNMFSVENIWMKLLPYIPHIIGGVILIFVLYILMDKLPQILAQLSELAEILKSREVAQQAIANITT